MKISQNASVIVLETLQAGVALMGVVAGVFWQPFNTTHHRCDGVTNVLSRPCQGLVPEATKKIDKEFEPVSDKVKKLRKYRDRESWQKHW